MAKKSTDSCNLSIAVNYKNVHNSQTFHKLHQRLLSIHEQQLFDYQAALSTHSWSHWSYKSLSGHKQYRDFYRQSSSATRWTSSISDSASCEHWRIINSFTEYLWGVRVNPQASFSRDDTSKLIYLDTIHPSSPTCKSDSSSSSCGLWCSRPEQTMPQREDCEWNSILLWTVSMAGEKLFY